MSILARMPGREQDGEGEEPPPALEPSGHHAGRDQESGRKIAETSGVSRPPVAYDENVKLAPVRRRAAREAVVPRPVDRARPQASASEQANRRRPSACVKATGSAPS